MVDWWTRRRQQRLRRREIDHALRSEFELEPRRGLARLRALMHDVGELERARMTSRARALDEAARPSAVGRTTSRRWPPAALSAPASRPPGRPGRPASPPRR